MNDVVYACCVITVDSFPSGHMEWLCGRSSVEEENPIQQWTPWHWFSYYQMENDWVHQKMRLAPPRCKFKFLLLSISMIELLWHCSFAVMSKCWLENPEDRPDFSELCSIMDQFLSLISDYAELNIVLVEEKEENFGMHYLTWTLKYNVPLRY